MAVKPHQIMLGIWDEKVTENLKWELQVQNNLKKGGWRSCKWNFIFIKSFVFKVKVVGTNNQKQFKEVFAMPKGRNAKKKENKTKLALFVLPVRLRYRHISYQLIARFCHFSHFLFNLKKTTMNLLSVVKINSMTFTDRNLYTRKKNRFPFRNNYT